jgi:hypothetical protein
MCRYGGIGEVIGVIGASSDFWSERARGFPNEMPGMRGGAKSPLLCRDFHVQISHAPAGLFMIDASMRDYLARLGHLAGFLVLSAMMAACPARAGRITHPVAVFSGLDKITGRTIAFEASSGETVQFGTLQITERACYTRPATEAPQTTSFVEVDEIDAGKKYKRIFSGWMFAASPGLHGIEHPIYDIWLTDCTGGNEPGEVVNPIDPNEVPPVPPDMPQNSVEEPSTPPPPPPPPHRGHHHQGKTRAPATGEPMDAPPADPRDKDPPPVDGPIEVAPPPGFIPVPQGNRGPPAQQN